MSMHIGSALPSGPSRAALLRGAARSRPWPAKASGWAARAGCGALLLAALPVMVLAAVAVLATSAGPTLTRSGHLGPEGRLVFLRQFRTTYRRDIEDEASPGRSCGVTPVGSVLRRSGIARLPVLLDVWQGRIGLAAAFRV